MNFKKDVAQGILLLVFTLAFVLPAKASTEFSSSPNLKLGDTGSPVLQLQKYLNSKGYIINTISGQPGSVGNETNKFGDLTKQALIKFQKDNGITPAIGYFGPKTKVKFDSLSNLISTDGKSGKVLGAMTNGVYNPPVGIPAPSFGINETYRMYDNPAKRNPALTYTQNAEGGYYTHYVDSTNSSCTYNWEINNGTPARPRCDVPRNLPAGSIVEIHNGASLTGPDGDVFISGVGSSVMPIFIRGVGMPDIHYLGVGFYGNAKYIIIENLEFSSGGVVGRRSDPAMGGEVFENSYISIRNSDIHGHPDRTGFGIASYSSNTVSNIVLYNDKFHECGDKTATSQDLQAHGVTINEGSYIWIVDSEVYNNGGSGIQVNAGFDAVKVSKTHHIYVGRNKVHDNKQAGIWFKEASDGIVSQNDMYSSDPTVTGLGGKGQGCGGYQLGPERIWFIFNYCHDIQIGFLGGSPDTPAPGLKNYFIGNIISNIHHFPGVSDDPSNPSAQTGAAIVNWAGFNRYIVNNTIYGVDAGINSPDGDPWFINNNIISNVTQANHIFLYNPSNWEADHNLFYQNGDFARVKIGDITYDVPQLQSKFTQAQSNQNANPLFTSPTTSDFRLTSASPAINAGTESDVYQTFQNLYGLNIRVDFDGNPRPQSSSAWDIGAFEYTGEVAVSAGPYTLTSSAGEGGTITGNNNTYTDGVAANLTAVPSSGYAFSSWSGCTATSGAECTVMMNSNKSVRATFYPITTVGTNYILTTTIGVGGLVNGNNNSYASGTTATLTANPSAGYTFSSWDGCTTISGTTCTVVMDSDKSVSASFAAIVVSGGGGSSGGSGGAGGGGGGSYGGGTSTGGSGVIDTGTTNTNTTGPYTLTVSKAGLGTGTISGLKTSYTKGVKASITATAKRGSVFAGWSGSCVNKTGKCVVLMDANKSAIATFNLKTTNTTSAKSTTVQSLSSSIDLKLGMTNEGVVLLQQYLNSNGYIVNQTDGKPGSVGNESNYFGEKTRQALISFQKDNDITPTQGYFGAKTKAKMDELESQI